ncbi:hypothetical protein M0802_016560 [Mischocyttarus mexicanus]|nr:hypothetical protein M0802_016560 [Mischocyttarus mexicanus]
MRRESALGMRTLADEAQWIIRALENMQMPVKHWDVWLVYTLATKLDPESLRAWESLLNERDCRLNSTQDFDVIDKNVMDRFPKIAELLQFLEQRARTLGVVAKETHASEKEGNRAMRPIPGSRRVHHTTPSSSANVEIRCLICTDNHRLLECARFAARPPRQRREQIRRLGLCFVCLGNHRAANCNSRERCSRCQGAHHTLLHGSIAHRSNASGPSAGNGSGETNKADDQPSGDFRVHTASIATGRHSVLLATAQLTVVGPHGRSTRARALLDQGSEGPRFSVRDKRAYLSRMSSQLPNRQIREVNSDWLAGLALADVHFTVPDSVDIILGADVYGRLLRSGVRNFPDTCLVAQDTALGWIISGPVSLEGPRRAVPRGHIAIQTSHCKTDGGLDDALRRFWELEELPCIQRRVEAYQLREVGAGVERVEYQASALIHSIKAELETEASTRTASSAGNVEAVERPSGTAKLPRVPLPSFSGRVEEWESFRDLFTTLVHDSPELSDSTKLQYLKGCLKGPAAELIKNVATTNANYHSAWLGLRQRFYHPRLIVNNHLRALTEIPSMRRESALGMRTLADEAQWIIRALENMQMPVKHWDVWLVYTLATKLDPESLRAWESLLNERDCRLNSTQDFDVIDKNVMDRFPKIAELLQFLEQRARTLGVVAKETHASEKEGNRAMRPIPGSRRVHHTTPSSSANVEIRCLICTDNHRLLECARFAARPPRQRREQIRRLGLCFVCLGNHRAANCNSRERCSRCQGAHHTLLHGSIAHRSNASGPSAGNGSGETNKADDQPSGDFRVHTASIATGRHSVLLATAQLTVVGPHGRSTRARALLDQGSEVSFVSETIANLLGLQRRRVDVSLTGVGACPAGKAKSATRLVMRSLRDPGFQFETNALICPGCPRNFPTDRSGKLTQIGSRD